MESPFDSWMERHHAQHPGLILPDQCDAGKVLLQKHGNQHEEIFLRHLIDQGTDVAIINDSHEAAQLTMQAMRDGREVVYQANLAVGQFAGKADFLFRVNKQSALGAHSYEAWDTKLARKAKPYFIVQLCCYSEMIARLQGDLPEVLKVVLGDLAVKEFRTADYFHYYMQLKQSFLLFQERFDRSNPPDCAPGTYSRWTDHAAQYLDECDHLSLVANIRKAQIKRLADCGISTLTALATVPEETKVPRLADETLQCLRAQARLQLETAVTEKTAFEMLPACPGKGLSLLPFKSAKDVFFDMEGYPYAEGGLEYLFGVSCEENGSICFRDWWAHNRVEEKIAFEQFIDWIYARWRQDPSMHIYHYANYEVAALRRLAGRHSTRVEQLDDLLREGKFIDLYQITRQSLRVGESSYSIKSIEHLFRSKREGTVATAMDSVVFYDRWLEDPDGSTWQESRILGDIRAYNEIDCLSTKQLADWLWVKQNDLGIAYGGKVKKESLPAPKQLSPAALLAMKLVDSAAAVAPETKDLQLLLAHLLEFHKREAKPIWWRMYDRQTMTIDELKEDLDCLADLRRTKRPPLIVRKSKGFEYSFDPDQDFKLVEGEECLIVDDLRRVKLEFLDREKGFALLVTSAKKGPPPDQLSLMRDDYVASETIEDSILKVVCAWQETKQLPGALSTLLLRQEPKITGRLTGAPIVSANDVEAISNAIKRMDHTTLCIQGPPGSGKTYTASHAIAELLKNGKRVAISSNSHKAIDKLLIETAAIAKSSAGTTNGIKVGPAGSNANAYEQFGLAFATNAKDLLERKGAVNYNLGRHGVAV